VSEPTETSRAKPSASRRGVQWIVVVAGGTFYVIRSAQIREVDMVETITPVPNAPPFVAGVANLRGEVVPVVDLRARLGLTATEVGLGTRIVVADVDERRVGLLVDRAREVAYFEESAILPAPEMSSGSVDFVRGVIARDEQILFVLDVEAVTNV
jgi:purine-binding chemotaxis protein CheW